MVCKERVGLSALRVEKSIRPGVQPKLWLIRFKIQSKVK